MEYILKTHNLTKVYKGQYALKNVNMNIAKGDIYGFVGENGSGKTTIIRLITGLIFPTSGDYELFGIASTDKEILHAREKVGAIVETPSIYLNFSARENLKMQGQIIGLKNEEKIKEVLQEVGLIQLYDSHKRVNDFSLGMRQRLGIAMALLSEPEFIILDEPMNGLDPAGIVDIRELILKLNQEKKITFLISSHILTELSLVATKYGIISKGHMLKEITCDELKNECRNNISIKVDDAQTLKDIVLKYHSIDDIVMINNGVQIYGECDLNTIVSDIIKANLKIESIYRNETNIEDYYLNIIGGKHNG